MRLKVLACKVLFRELSLIAATSENIIDITYIRQDFHNEPDFLRKNLQNEIDKLDAANDPYSYQKNKDNDFDAILLSYGLCSNGISGLSSKRYKLVIPKAHDCITLLLGSKEKYMQYFETHKGIYWYSVGWIENSLMPGKKRYETTRDNYVQNYGEENADYLMEMEQSWFKEYKWCTFIDWWELDNKRHKDYTRQCAEYLSWNYDELSGDSSLIRDFINGNWDADRFISVPPGHTVKPSYDCDVIKCEL